MDRNKVDLQKKEEIVGKIVRAEGNKISIGFNRWYQAKAYGFGSVRLS